MLSDLFSAEKRYLNYFFDHIDHQRAEMIFHELFHAKGTIFFTGIGKSGKIAEKIVQTMISTGTRAMYLEPVGALHGDIGILERGDLLICLTKSGDSQELIDLVAAVKKKVPIKTIAWISNLEGRILPFVDQYMWLPLEAEICPFNLAPTTSCAVQLIFGDIMAMAIMKAKTFSIADYALNHPAGAIGQKIALKAKDLMLEGQELPLCSVEDLLCDVLVVLSDKRCGALLVVDHAMRLLGIFTDGDLRRAIQNNKDQVFQQSMAELMTSSYLYAHPETSARDLLKIMEGNPQRRVMMLPILEEGIVRGLVHMHDVISPFRRQRKKTEVFVS
jgi:arabinose-5-phosphate isomerase